MIMIKTKSTPLSNPPVLWIFKQLASTKMKTKKLSGVHFVELSQK